MGEDEYFTDRVIDDYGSVEFAYELATQCVSLFDIDEAGIMLAESDGTLHYLASSSERMRLVELFELQHDEGPCLDAFRSGVAVAGQGADDAVRRWPKFGPQALAAGFGSVAAVPMRLRSIVIGAVNLFSLPNHSLSERDQSIAQALADITTIGILQERARRHAQRLAFELRGALDSRVVIEQAKGMVAAHARVGLDDAFEILRAYARRNQQPLTDVTRTVVTGALALSRLRPRQ